MVCYFVRTGRILRGTLTGRREIDKDKVLPILFLSVIVISFKLPWLFLGRIAISVKFVFYDDSMSFIIINKDINLSSC